MSLHLLNGIARFLEYDITSFTMDSSDRTVDEMLWHGQLAVQFIPGSDVETTESCHILVPRVAYLPFCMEQIAEHFNLNAITANLAKERLAEANDGSTYILLLNRLSAHLFYFF